MLAAPSLGKLATKVPDSKPLRLFCPSAWAGGRISVQMHSAECRFVVGPSNKLYRLETCMCALFQTRKFTCLGSVGVNRCRTWSPHGWVTVTSHHMDGWPLRDTTWTGDRYERGHHMDGWPLRAWSPHGRVTATSHHMDGWPLRDTTWTGDRYERGHHMDGWPLRAWSLHGRVTVTC